jgi:hypothetical protein
MTDDHEYYRNKRTDRTYISRAFEDHGQRMRMLSKVIDTEDTHEFATLDGERTIVVKPGQRQEILAVFYEDTRKIKRITLQKFDTESGEPIKHSFTFRKEELDQLEKALQAIRFIDMDEDEKQRLDDDLLDARFASASELRRFFAAHKDIAQEIVRHDITTHEVIGLGYRKEQLRVFEQLMTNEVFFATKKAEWGKKRDEDVWQHFFEANTWIFGHGLDYVFRTSLDDRRLEQYTSGHSISGAGKRVDALLKTKGALSVLCFVEIKIHTTPLVGRNPRSECWSISNELADAVAQIQKTVNKAVHDIQERLEVTDTHGFPTGEIAYLCQPKSFVVIGHLGHFVGEAGVNQEQFTSFELFRRQCTSPEIITFDELFQRAQFIVHHDESHDASVGGEASDPASDAAARSDDASASDDDIPF